MTPPAMVSPDMAPLGMAPLGVPQASTVAPEVDALIGALLAISLAVLALVFGLLLTYVVRYRAGSDAFRGDLAAKTWRVEIAWTAATLLVFFGLFVWGADLYARLFEPPSATLNINVVGKQWMWKIEHPGGQREINALHVPVGRPVRLVLTSEDVIHDFSIPAFRLKHDVVPGRYLSIWFQADRIGDYPFFCTQFCGTDHAAMRGAVHVMSQPDYARWLDGQPASRSLVRQGQTLFMRFGCSGCHQAGNGLASSTVHAPSLNGIYGRPVALADGSTVIADDRYLHDSMTDPNSQVVAGYAPVMPTFAHVASEAEILDLIAYIRSLSQGG
jgi:cytochrome c oxidase subunit 2